MAAHGLNPGVDAFLARSGQWREAFEQLRAIVLDCGLVEELKWGVPCYTFQGRNVVLMHGFKHYCALLFFKGVLLTDTEAILVRQTENVQAARQIRFTAAQQVVAMRAALKNYLEQAVAVEAAGLKVAFKTAAEFQIPDELNSKFGEIAGLEDAFFALSPGRQRAYLLHFSGARQARTRQSRIEKNVPRILSGKGLDD